MSTPLEDRGSGMAYLAAPYSHHRSEIKAARQRLVTLVAHELIRSGIFVYSPLTHNTPVAKLGIADTAEVWRAHDHMMVKRSDRLFVLQLPGWEQFHLSFSTWPIGWE